jgi:hypothetical protein
MRCLGPVPCWLLCQDQCQAARTWELAASFDARSSGHDANSNALDAVTRRPAPADTATSSAAGMLNRASTTKLSRAASFATAREQPKPVAAMATLVPMHAIRTESRDSGRISLASAWGRICRPFRLRCACEQLDHHLGRVLALAQVMPFKEASGHDVNNITIGLPKWERSTERGRLTAARHHTTRREVRCGCEL